MDRAGGTRSADAPTGRTKATLAPGAETPRTLPGNRDDGAPK